MNCRAHKEIVEYIKKDALWQLSKSAQRGTREDARFASQHDDVGTLHGSKVEYIERCLLMAVSSKATIKLSKLTKTNCSSLICLAIKYILMKRKCAETVDSSCVF